MAKLTISSTHPNLDGTYELELAGGFTKAEYYMMKKNVGVTVNDMMPGSGIDMNVMTAWGLVAIRRAGKEHLFAAFMDTTDEQTTWDFDEDEVEEDAALPTMSGSDDAAKPNEPSGSSGPSTNGASDVSLEIHPVATGSPLSATTAISDPETSQT
jgi:hypothetical protein